MVLNPSLWLRRGLSLNLNSLPSPNTNLKLIRHVILFLALPQVDAWYEGGWHHDLIMTCSQVDAWYEGGWHPATVERLSPRVRARARVRNRVRNRVRVRVRATLVLGLGQP